jgi:hypothetical protein
MASPQDTSLVPPPYHYQVVPPGGSAATASWVVNVGGTVGGYWILIGRDLSGISMPYLAAVLLVEPRGAEPLTS